MAPPRIPHPGRTPDHRRHGPRNPLRTRARDTTRPRLRGRERNHTAPRGPHITNTRSSSRHGGLRAAARACLAGLRGEEWVLVDRDEEELESGEWVGVARGDDEVHE